MTKTLAFVALLAALTAAQKGEIITDPIFEVPGESLKEPKLAYCKMKYDPTNPTTYPYGLFKFYQANYLDDVHIKGYMKQMPPPASHHGLHINYKSYPGQ